MPHSSHHASVKKALERLHQAGDPQVLALRAEIERRSRALKIREARGDHDLVEGQAILDLKLRLSRLTGEQPPDDKRIIVVTR